MNWHRVDNILSSIVGDLTRLQGLCGDSQVAAKLMKFRAGYKEDFDERSINPQWQWLIFGVTGGDSNRPYEITIDEDVAAIARGCGVSEGLPLVDDSVQSWIEYLLSLGLDDIVQEIDD